MEHIATILFWSNNAFPVLCVRKVNVCATENATVNSTARSVIKNHFLKSIVFIYVFVQQCIDGIVCAKGEKLCGGVKCYSSFQGQQCFNGIVCEKGEIVCGTQCYSRKLTLG